MMRSALLAVAALYPSEGLVRPDHCPAKTLGARQIHQPSRAHRWPNEPYSHSIHVVF
jgi:hypothetical protein